MLIPFFWRAPSRAHTREIWGFTYDEITEVVVARFAQTQTMAIVCSCGHVQLMLTRDSGFSLKWIPAAYVMEKLRTGSVIDGRLD